MEEPKKETPPPILDQLKEYVETRIKLARYQAIDGGSRVAASLIADAVIVISLVLAFIFASCTLAFFLGQLFGATWIGFGCVSLIYLIIALVIRYKKPGIEKRLTNEFIEKIFKD